MLLALLPFKVFSSSISAPHVCTCFDSYFRCWFFLQYWPRATNSLCSTKLHLWMIQGTIISYEVFKYSLFFPLLSSVPQHILVSAFGFDITIALVCFFYHVLFWYFTQEGCAIDDRQLLNLTAATENLELDSPAFNLHKQKSPSDSVISETSLDSTDGKKTRRLSVRFPLFCVKDNEWNSNI